MGRKSYTEAPECMSDLALSQFRSGQTLCFKITVRPGFHAHVIGRFVKAEKGLVHAKAKEIMDPSWYDWYAFDRKYPGRVVRLRPKSCYLWGKSLGDDPWASRNSHCH